MLVCHNTSVEVRVHRVGSLQHVGSRDQTQIVRLGSRHPYLASQPNLSYFPVFIVLKWISQSISNCLSLQRVLEL